MKKQKISFADLKKQYEMQSYLSEPNSAGSEEGPDKTHINVSIQSKNELGRILSPEYLKTFAYPNLGKFSSVTSLWYWIRNTPKDDNIRRLSGIKLRAYVAANQLYGGYVRNFKAIIAYATWLKLKSYPDLLKELEEFDGAFMCYTINRETGLRIASKNAVLMTDTAKEIRSALREGREPCFDFLADGKDQLYYVQHILVELIGADKVKALLEPKEKAQEEKVDSKEAQQELTIDQEP